MIEKWQLIAICLGVGRPHFVGNFERRSNLDQRPLADSRAPAGGFAPGRAVRDKFRPEGKEAALDGLDGVDRAVGVLEEGALAVLAARFAQAALVAGTVNVAALEFLLVHSKISGNPGQVGLGQIDEAGNLAAFTASGLAGKAEHATSDYQQC